MKARNTSFMAGLLITVILGASDLIAATSIEHSISGANDAKISRIIGITNTDEISIDEIGNDGSPSGTSSTLRSSTIDAGIAKIKA